jgi:ABC-2 type transport system permease protein
MSKVSLVIRQEIINTLTRRSFLLAVFGLPLISFLVFFGVSLLQREAPGTVSNIFGGSSASQALGEGYVDLSGVIQSMPDYLPEGMLQAFADETAARQALDDGEIQAFFLIPADYLDSGAIVYIRPDFNPLSAFDRAFVIQDVLRYNLLGGDSRLAAMVQSPLDLSVTVLEGSSERDEDNPLTFFLPYAVTMLYYISILTSASYLLSSIAKEKENRVLEILLVTVKPAQLLTGKFIALGLMGLLQNVLWVASGLILMRLSGRTLALPAAFQLPPAFLFWGIIFFIFGYGLYASQMAGVGALVPNLREASQATFVVIFPMIIPLFFISILIEEPNGTLATILSLIPWTASVTMMMRLAAGSVPLWQLLASSALLAVTAFLILRSVVRLFRAQTLLSGQPFNVKIYLIALLGRA